MTREKALQVSSLLYKIETYEALPLGQNLQQEISGTYSPELEDELIAVVRSRLDKLLKEFEEM